MGFRSRFCCTAFVLLTAATAALATDRTWTGQGGDNRWLTPQNWSGNVAPSGNADVAIFPAGTPAAVLLDQSIGIKTVYFRNPGMTLSVTSGVNLAFSNLGTLTMQAAENAAIDGEGTLTFSVNSGEDFADNQASSGKTLTLLARITGANGFEFNGVGGTIVLANPANDYSGNTVMTSSGILAVPSVANAGLASPLGKGSAFKITSTPCTFRYTGTGHSTDRTFYQNAGASQDATIEHAGSGTLKFTGPFLSGNNNGHAFIFNVVATNAVIENAGVISNGYTAGLWLYKRGLGTQILSAANTYTGNTVLDEGILALKPWRDQHGVSDPDARRHPSPQRRHALRNLRRDVRDPADRRLRLDPGGRSRRHIGPNHLRVDHECRRQHRLLRRRPRHNHEDLHHGPG